MRSTLLALSPSGRRLTTWKEIGSYIGRDARTAKRYEAERGLPVHRMPGGGKSVVFAYSGEVDLWLRETDPGAGEIARVAADPTSASDPAFKPNSDGYDPRPNGSLVDSGSSRLSPPGGLRAVLLTLLLLLACASSGWLSLRQRSPAVAVTPASASPDALREYQLGRYDWNHRTPDSLRHAVDDFTQALVRDPNFALAYAGLADCYLVMPQFGGLSPADAYPRARAAATRAVALDPKLAAAHRALGFISFYWDQNAALSEREFQTALRLDPDSAQTHHWFANTLATRGDAKAALREIGRASSLDPTSTSILADKGWVLLMAGDVNGARSLLTAVEAADPAYVPAYRYMGDALRLSDDYAGMLQQWSRVADLSHDDTLKAVVAAGVKALPNGKHAVLRALVTAREALFPRGSISPFQLAGEEMEAGRPDQALNYLEKSAVMRDPAFLALRTAPEFRPLHSDARFQRLARRAPLSLAPPG